MMAGIRGRRPGSGVPSSGGKAKGTKNTRQMGTAEIREAIRQDIMAVYARLGSGEWLYNFALQEPALFLSHCWSRIAPPIPKENPDIVNQMNVQVQLDSMSELEKARRVAYLLNSASARLGLPVNEHQPVKTPDWRLPDPVIEPIDVAAIAKQQKDDELIRNTIDGTYAGNSNEQGFKRRKNLI